MKTTKGMKPNTRILIVDDSPSIHSDFRKILCTDTSEKDAFAARGAALFGDDEAEAPLPVLTFEMDSAYQGQEALEMVKKSVADGWPYATAFVDVRMPPGWDGIETIAHLWEVCPNLQVVICSAYSDYTLEEIVARVGLSESMMILKKPFENSEIRKIATTLAYKWAGHRAPQLPREGKPAATAEKLSPAVSSPMAGSANTTDRSILLLEGDVNYMNSLSNALNKHLPRFHVLKARTIEEAQMLFGEFPVDFFILDIELPDGNGLDFMADVRTVSPEAKIVVMTNTPLRQYFKVADSLSALKFMEKPVDVTALCSIVQSHVDAGEGPQLFSASLSQLSVLDLIQLKCLSCATMVLELHLQKITGRIFIESGEIVHAETPGSTGLEALADMLRWKGGHAAEGALKTGYKRTITGPWQYVLLTVATTADENAEASK